MECRGKKIIRSCESAKSTNIVLGDSNWRKLICEVKIFTQEITAIIFRKNNLQNLGSECSKQLQIGSWWTKLCYIGVGLDNAVITWLWCNSSAYEIRLWTTCCSSKLASVLSVFLHIGGHLSNLWKIFKIHAF